MTRKQVRSQMRRLRAEVEDAEDEGGEINLVPYMDIVTNIIIFLLASVVNAIPLGNVNVTLPSISQGGSSSSSETDEKPLSLTVTAGGTGFTIAASGGIMPVIPKKPNGDYDYPALAKQLADIKKEFPKETKATFNADAGTQYSTVVDILDVMRGDEGGRTKDACPLPCLFPDIVFAAGIL